MGHCQNLLDDPRINKITKLIFFLYFEMIINASLLYDCYFYNSNLQSEIGF